MNRNTLLTLSAMLALSASGCKPAQQPPLTSSSVATGSVEVTSAIGDPKQQALAARDALFKQLSARLVAVMSNGGPAAAIEVCSRDAPRIAASVGKEYGVSIGRTSFKLRNPKNAPPEWANALIEEKTEGPQFIELSDGGTGALLPIKLKTQCLTCHGPTEQIADDVKARLAELYPDDRATGFQDGDLRGWFWVVVPTDERMQPVTIN